MHLGPISDNRAKVQEVCGTALGSRIHLSTILLIDESDGDVLGFCEECRIVVLADFVESRSEGQAI